MKVYPFLICVFALILGVGCLNYTKAFGVDTHIKFAKDAGLPEPSIIIFYCGLALLITSCITLGFMFGSKNRSKSD